MQAPSHALISELLMGMRLFGVQFLRLELPERRGIGFTNDGGRAQFHFVGRGPVWLHSPSGTLHRLDTGDAVLVPRGGHHKVLPAEHTPLSNVDPLVLPVMPAGNSCEQAHPVPLHQGAVLFSCCMGLELGGMQPLVNAMPEVLHVSTLLERYPEVHPILEAMVRESLMLQPGHLGILGRLAEVVAALVVRSWATSGEGGAMGWLGALQDPQLGKAMLMMHKHPEKQWTVATLASHAHQSRSVFAQRFLQATGLSPLRYLTALRMRLACQRLRHEGLPLDTIANELGYGSVAAFSRAFKRSVGRSPGAVRNSLEPTCGSQAGYPARGLPEERIYAS